MMLPVAAGNLVSTDSVTQLSFRDDGGVDVTFNANVLRVDDPDYAAAWRQWVEAQWAELGLTAPPGALP